MAHQIDVKRAAVKELSRLPRESRRRCAEVIDGLALDPHPPGSRKLVDSPFYRVHVGDYRIIYDIDGDAEVITILRVRHRREVYRGL